jgi:hypothetical protein
MILVTAAEEIQGKPMTPSEYTMWQERAKTGKNADQLQAAYEDLIARVKRIDPITLAEATDGQYRGDGVPRVEIAFLHSWFVLDLLPYRVRAAHRDLDTLPMKVLVLQHFLAAAENVGTAVRVMGEWIDRRSLQNGAVMGAHWASSVEDKLGKFFAQSRNSRWSKVLKVGGKKVDLGDVAFLFHFFPRLPVAFVHWVGDEDFPPSNKVLYDVSAGNYMPTHGLVALTEFLVHYLADED